MRVLSPRLPIFVFYFGLHLSTAIPPLKPTIPGFALHKKLFSKYNKFTLPVEKTGDKVNIRLLLELVSLTDIDEKNQIMTTQVWVKHEWNDAGLVWDPLEFNNITQLNLPAEDLWLPDTVLYNNADGDYQITIKSKVKVLYTGLVIYTPPAIYKSFCLINVKFFPFDISKVDYWLYDIKDANKTLTHFLPEAADILDYGASVEWDILEITGQRSDFRYPCCPERYVDVTYKIHIRRKALYYTINLIIPWMLISFITIFIFFLPSQSGEKITLSISVLVAMTMFLLMLYEIIPPTSLVIPLMSKYLLFTLLLVTTSIAITVMVLTFHFRHAHAFHMPQWIRTIFLCYLPKILFAESPLTQKWYLQDRNEKTGEEDGEEPDPLETIPLHRGLMIPPDIRDEFGRRILLTPEDENCAGEVLDADDIKQILRDVRYISRKYRENIEEDRRKAEWQAFARIIDRLFLVLSGAAVIIGTFTIFAAAPGLYDNRPKIA